MSTLLTGSDSYYPEIATDKEGTADAGTLYGNTYSYGGAPIRLVLAVQCSANINPPVHYVGQKQTDDSYQDWALKCFKMADALIDEYNRKIK